MSQEFKEFSKWTRETLKYNDPSIKQEHFDKICRNSGKDVFAFLQSHVKTEDEIRAIKENVEIFGLADEPEKSDEKSEEQMLDEEYERILREIELTEDRIKDAESQESKKGNVESRASNEIQDLQKKRTFLIGILENTEAELNNLEAHVRDFDKYVMDCGMKRSQDQQDECSGCKSLDASLILQDLVGGSKTKLDDSQLKSQVAAGVAELLQNHSIACIVNNFVGESEAIDIMAVEVECEPSWKKEESIPVFYKIYSELMSNISKSTENRANLEWSVVNESNRLIQSISSSKDDLFSRFVKSLLHSAGLRGSLEHFAMIKIRHEEFKKKLDDLKSQLGASNGELEKVAEELFIVDETIRTDLDEAKAISISFAKKKTESEQSIYNFITTLESTMGLVRLLKTDSENENFSNLISAVKPSDIFENASTSEDATLAGLFRASSELTHDSTLDATGGTTSDSSPFASLLQSLLEAYVLDWDERKKEEMQIVLKALNSKEHETRRLINTLCDDLAVINESKGEFEPVFGHLQRMLAHKPNKSNSDH